MSDQVRPASIRPARQDQKSGPLYFFFGRGEFERAVERQAQFFSTAAEMVFDGLPAFGEHLTRDLNVIHEDAKQQQRFVACRLQQTLITYLDAEDIFAILSAFTRLIDHLRRIGVAAANLTERSFPSRLPDLCHAALGASEALSAFAVDIKSDRALWYFLSTIRANDRDLRRVLRECLADSYSPGESSVKLAQRLDLLGQFTSLRRRFKQTSAIWQQIHFKNG